MIRLLAAAAIATTLSGAAFAQSNDNASKTQNIQTANTGWQVICRPMGNDRAKLNCAVLSETFSANERVRIAAVEIVKGDKGRVMVVSVPSGVNLKEQIEFGIDAAKPTTLAYSHCLGNFCFATQDLSTATLDAMKKAKAVSFAFTDMQGSKVKAEILLEGFNAALAKSE